MALGENGNILPLMALCGRHESDPTVAVRKVFIVVVNTNTLAARLRRRFKKAA